MKAQSAQGKNTGFVASGCCEPAADPLGPAVEGEVPQSHREIPRESAHTPRPARRASLHEAAVLLG